jgi:hypothetical protein
MLNLVFTLRETTKKFQKSFNLNPSYTFIHVKQFHILSLSLCLNIIPLWYVTVQYPCHLGQETHYKSIKFYNWIYFKLLTLCYVFHFQYSVSCDYYQYSNHFQLETKNIIKSIGYSSLAKLNTKLYSENWQVNSKEKDISRSW